MTSDGHSSLARRAGLVAAAVMISRVLGLVREQVIAAVFGASKGPVTDAFNIAFRVPNLLRDLFAEGALSAAFVPTFTGVLREDRAAAWRLFNVVLNALAVLLGIVTLGIVFFAPELVGALAGGAAPEKAALAVTLTRITAPFLILVSFAALAMGALNACGRFFLPSLAPALFNCAMIACALLMPRLLPRWGMEPAAALALGAVAGGALQLLVQIPDLRREGCRWRPLWSLRDPGLVRIARMMGPAVIGMAIVQVSIFIDTRFAASLPGDGPISWLQFAFRIMHLPIGIVGVAVGTVHLVEAARHAAAGRIDEIRGAVERALRLTALLALPAAVGLVVLRVPIVRLLYEHGRFSPSDTEATAQALVWYAAAIVTWSAVKIFVPTFYAMNDTRLPLLASASGIAAKVAASVLLIGPLGHAGLAASTLAATAVNAAILGVALARRAGAYVGRRAMRAMLGMAAAAALMGVGVDWAYGVADRSFGHAATGPQIAAVGLAVGIGMIFYAGAVVLLGVEDGEELIEALRRRKPGG